MILLDKDAPIQLKLGHEPEPEKGLNSSPGSPIARNESLSFALLLIVFFPACTVYIWYVMDSSYAFVCLCITISIYDTTSVRPSVPGRSALFVESDDDTPRMIRQTDGTFRINRSLIGLGFVFGFYVILWGGGGE